MDPFFLKSLTFWPESIFPQSLTAWIFDTLSMLNLVISEMCMGPSSPRPTLSFDRPHRHPLSSYQTAFLRPQSSVFCSPCRRIFFDLPHTLLGVHRHAAHAILFRQKALPSSELHAPHGSKLSILLDSSVTVKTARIPITIRAPPLCQH